MRAIFAALIFSVCVLASLDAVADTTQLFPPANIDNCNPSDPLATGYLGWNKASGSTECRTATEVLRDALGAVCKTNQVVGSNNGTSFSCFDIPTNCAGGINYNSSTHTFSCNNTPTCPGGLAFDGTSYKCINTPPVCNGANQSLNFDGTNYTCVTSSTPTNCAAGYVLTYTNGSFTCVADNASVPSCGANQFLTYGNGQFQCASVQNTAIPSCGANQMVTANGSSFSCVDLPSSSGTGNWCGWAMTYSNQWAQTVSSCQGYPVMSWPLGSCDATNSGNSNSCCPAGYTQKAMETGAVSNDENSGPTPLTLYVCMKN